MKVAENAKWNLSDIYQEDRYKTPKHTFKMCGDKLEESFPSLENKKILDLGTAEGALPYYLYGRFPGIDITGFEYDPDLVELSQKNVPQMKTYEGDANDLSQFEDQHFDATCCLGVISIFDDFRPSVKEMIRVTKKGGVVIINNMWNAFPVDLIIKTRMSKPGAQDDFVEGPWGAGWNMVSLNTMSEFLKNIDRVENFSFEKVILPVDLQPRKDNPLRAWTLMSPDGQRYHMNGLGRMLDKRMLQIQL